MSRNEPPPCRSCGACCVCTIEMDYYCELLEDDLPHLSSRFKAKHVTPKLSWHEGRMGIRAKWIDVKTGPYRGLRVNACAALRGSPMSRVSCSIYENRPSICFEFVRGALSCKHAIIDLALAVEQAKEKGKS